nr:unnamed protein product [Callosobruchus chinensis]
MIFQVTVKIVLSLITVVAIADEITDPVTTTVIPVPIPPKSIDISRIFISPGIGNVVRLDWGTPLRSNTTYWVYYGKDDDELTSPRLTTQNTSVVIPDLEFCTKYKFAVSVAGEGDGEAHINQNNVRNIVTYADRMAAPQNFRVDYEPREVPCMIIEWSASCPNVGQALGYVISAFQHSTSKYVIVTFPASTRSDFTYRMKVDHGEKFDVKISTNFPGSKPTDTVTFKVPGFLQPFKVKVSANEENGSFMIYWQEPYLPDYIDRIFYEVRIYKGSNITSTAENYYVIRPVMVYKGEGIEYTFRVRAVSYGRQFWSPLTDPIVANIYGETRELDESTRE